MSLYSTVLSNRLLGKVASGLLFLAAWLLLNVMFNLRYPARIQEPAWWYLLPSMDATALLGILALLGGLRRELPRRVLIVLAGIIIFVRLYRIADGLIQQNYFRSLHLTLDVPLLPELARLLASTVSTPKLILGAVGLVVGIAVLVVVIGGALLHSQKFLASGPIQRGLFVAVAVVIAALGKRWPPDQFAELHKGLYGRSIVPEMATQVHHAASASRARMVKAAEIAAAQRRLARTPAGLEYLGGADVMFFLVESYGATVFRDPDFFTRMQPSLESFSTTLSRLGYFSATGSLESSTYGGASWLAHATLASGVRISDAREFALLRQTDPPPLTMAAFFQRAGHRTVVVQPGTTRRFPEGEVRGFDAKYYLPDLDYHGPPFGWATMPDQYVIDFIHRRELLSARKPVFVQYALVSSHAPWALQPAVVDDWSDLAQGRIFHKLPMRQYPVEWASMFRGGDAYVDSLIYDLEVIKRYVGQVMTRPALVIVMGDHQPPVLAGADASKSVPVHVLSKDERLIDRFLQIGYAPGMIPSAGGRSPSMETFLGTLIERLSKPARLPPPELPAVAGGAPTAAPTTARRAAR